MVNFQHVGIALVVGGVDEGLERADSKAGRTANFKKWSDIARLVGIGIGLAAQMSPRWAGLGDTVSTACLPLLAKSVSKVIAPESTTAGRVYGRVRAPAQAPAGSYGARSPEFDDVRLV